jgi:hypothetical protein
VAETTDLVRAALARLAAAQDFVERYPTDGEHALECAARDLPAADLLARVGEVERLREERKVLIRAANAGIVAVGVFKSQTTSPSGAYRKPGLGSFLAAGEAEDAYEEARRVLGDSSAALSAPGPEARPDGR